PTPQPDPLLVLLPLLIVLSTFLFLLLVFLICVLLIRRRRGIVLRDNDGPVDMSREELIEGEGGFEGVETRWLETVSDVIRRSYIRAKGRSAWSFEPDYETINSLLVHARTEITFLPDPASSSCVQSNLPLPKLNEVYYWETTNVAVGLATKPYPPSEGDVLGIGYRPRTGTVFYTRNGRKMEDAFIGLSRYNLFPTIGADGPCSVHVNLGQSGFVFIEANVKKWGLAPSVGTLAPPPAYGSERGSILLDVGGRVRPDGTPQGTPSASSVGSPSHRHRNRRPRNPGSAPVASSPLRTSSFPEPPPPLTPPPPITPIEEDPAESTAEPSTAEGDDPSQPLLERSGNASSSPSVSRSPSPDAGARNPFTNTRLHRHSFTHFATSLSEPRSDLRVHLHPPPESPLSPNPTNPPTPNQRDIHLQALSTASHRRTGSSASDRDAPTEDRLSSDAGLSRRDPPAYSPLDAYTYADGVQIDLPAEVITAALEGGTIPSDIVGQGNSSRSDRRRTRRR
ncbi:hypothetical protein BDQ17DRAFT_1340646, partial [Cyathus striatus]